jgi:hypothetical protein
VSNISVVRDKDQVRVITVQETEETLNVDELHMRIAECKRHEEMYEAKRDEWANKRLKYQRVLYEALGEELESAQGE